MLFWKLLKMDKKKLTYLKTTDYEHPWDTAARNALEDVPGFTAAITKLNEIGMDRLLRIQYTGSSLRVNKQNLPDLHEALEEACSILSVEKPDFYLQWGYDINGFTSGVDKPVIVLNSGCIDLLTRDELVFVISHELGHIKNKHVLYYQASSFLPFVSSIIENATLGLGGIITTAIQLSLLNWRRMAELTADRAGLLGCQSPKVAANALVKMAGLPKQYFSEDLVDEFIKQAKEFQEYDYDTLDKITKVLGTMFNSHPWTVLRASEILKWVDDENYSKLLDAHQDGNKKFETDEMQPLVRASTKPWRDDGKPWQ